MRSAAQSPASAPHRPGPVRGGPGHVGVRLAQRVGAGAIGIVMLSAGIGAAGQEPLVVPSGQEVRFLDTVQAAPGPEGLTIRFRFLAPAIARDTGTVGPEQAQQDMEWLCNNFALPRLSATGPAPSQVIVSLSDREVAFGDVAPEATQFFEAYTIADGHCVWEAF